MKKNVREKQQSFEFRDHGGFREGSGRPRKLIGDPPHTTRDRVNLKIPAHVTIKLNPNLPGLRTPKFMRSVLRAIKRAKSKGLNVLHFDIESNHAHFIIEAQDNETLSRGISSLKVSIVWALRKIFGYYGRVFKGRYHLETLTSPTQVKNAIKYVLFNHAKHLGVQKFGDAYSSVFAFNEIKALIGHALREKPPSWQSTINEAIAAPQSWLAKCGWKRAR